MRPTRVQLISEESLAWHAMPRVCVKKALDTPPWERGANPFSATGSYVLMCLILGFAANEFVQCFVSKHAFLARSSLHNS